jgi:hypothetical protein
VRGAAPHTSQDKFVALRAKKKKKKKKEEEEEEEEISTQNTVNQKSGTHQNPTGRSENRRGR